MTPVILVVLDGYGLAPPGPGNPISLANPPTLNSLLYAYPNTTLTASGEAVGLPPHEAGNTEVGHLNLGAGRVVYQDLPRINMSIAEGSFYKNPAFLKASLHIKETKGKLHLLGLVGVGSVHSELDHLYALLYFAKENDIKEVYLHLITDGRDSPPRSAIGIINQISEKLKQLGIGKIASVSGRYYALDRDRRWERVEKAYRSLTKGSEKTANSAQGLLQAEYDQNITDEFIEPSTITENLKPVALIQEGDAVIFFNFRIDRPRELTKAFVLDNFDEDANKSFSFDPYAVKYYKTHYPTEQIVTSPFSRGEKIKNLLFVTMTSYEKNLSVEVAFPPIVVQMPLGRVLSDRGLAQLRMAESEKERFVGFYFDGQRETAFPDEEKLIIPSPKVATYDLKPEMSAGELTELLIKKNYEQRFPFILINFANADMVGHTGNIEASVKAVKTLDICMEKIINVCLNTNCTLIITADHGNIEQKINPATGDISTEHTTNPVPFVVVNSQFKGKSVKLQSGILADVAPTILRLLDVPKPPEMTGRNLLEELS